MKKPLKNQLHHLRKNAINLLNLSLAQSQKSTLSDLVEELMIHQIELEIQNNNYVETQNLLMESHNKYANLFNFAPVGYFILDEMGLILDVNDVGSQILGFSKNMLINRIFARYISPDTQYIFSEFRKKLFMNRLQNKCEFKLLKKNGAMVAIRSEAKTVNDTISSKPYVLLLTMDMSDLQLAEEKSKDNHGKTTKSRELSSYLAEELNQPLAVMSNYIYGCIRRLENKTLNSQELLNSLKQTALQIKRATEIILRMKNFKYPDSLDKQLVLLDALIKESMELIQNEITVCPLTIIYREYKNISMVNMDKFHIQQVILNLARNSIEAMNDTKVADPKITIEINKPMKNTVEISIIDNGPGYSNEKMYQLFEPGFTTKNYGTGLGLAISRSIVESHGGQLFPELNRAYGSCFKVRLPIE